MGKLKIDRKQNRKTASKHACVKYRPTVTAAALAVITSLLLCSPVMADQEAKEYEKDSHVMYGIGSTSKMITSAAVMKLSEEGKLNLDTPLVEYIPEFTMNDSRYQNITPRMLLNHTSGLQGSSLKNSMLMADNDTYTHDTLLEQLKKQRLKADPGQFATYCNDGFTLAEILVERVSSMSFTDYINQTFAIPLKLSSFKTPQSIFPREQLANGYFSVTGWNIPQESPNVIGSGGIYSTAEDLCRFSQIFMDNPGNGAGILSGESVKAMESNELQKSIRMQNEDTTIAYGLGWDSVETYPFSRYGIKALSKGGDTTMYHAGFIVLPEENISCAVLSSGGSGTLNQIAVQEILLTYLDEIGRIERDEEAEKPGKPSGDVLTIPAEIKQYEGWYAGKEFYQISFTDDESMVLKSSQSGREITQVYRYRGDGYFYSDGGDYITLSGTLSRGNNGTVGSTVLSFQEGNEGQQYLMFNTHETYPGLGLSAVFIPAGQKIQENPVDKRIQEAWNERDGREYYLVSDKYSSTAYLDNFYARLKVFENPQGYLAFEDSFYAGAEIKDENRAEFFQQLPGQAGRDLYDYQILVEDGVEYMEAGAFRFISEDGIEPMDSHNSSIKIGDNGEGKWFSCGKELEGRQIRIEVPQEASFFVYDHGVRTIECVNGSYLMGDNQSFSLPKDGRIVFLGNPGAEFLVTFLDS